MPLILGLLILSLSIFGGGCQPSSSTEKTLTPPTESLPGESLFMNHCAGCHGGGGNTLNPSKPIQGSPLLSSSEGFITFLRSPGGSMPSFSTDQLSEADAKVLYTYLKETYGKPQ